LAAQESVTDGEHQDVRAFAGRGRLVEDRGQGEIRWVLRKSRASCT
jgi:hypothetical protein